MLTGVPCLQLCRMNSVDNHKLYMKCVAVEHCSRRTSWRKGARVFRHAESFWSRVVVLSVSWSAQPVWHARSIVVHIASMTESRADASAR